MIKFKAKKVFILLTVVWVGSLAFAANIISQTGKKAYSSEENYLTKAEPDKDIRYKSTRIADANSRLLAEAATKESRGLEYALLGC